MSSAELLWKQCVQWMCGLGVLPQKHKLLTEEANAEILAYTLRDGVLLCQITNSLSPGCIETMKINQRPQLAQFLCLKNIRLFLTACSETFDLVKETDLFDPSMLYDFTDFAKVLQTLSKLSQCSLAKQARPDVDPFPQTAAIACFSNDVYDGSNEFDNEVESEDEEEHIYRKLEDMHSEDKYREFYFHQHRISGRQRSQYSFSEDHDEKVYTDLCGIRRSGISSGQTHQELRSQFLSKFELREKRDYCIKELIETEGNYNDALNMLRQNFIKTMSTLTDSQKKTIFMNIIELGEVHAAFFVSLLESISGKSRRIGDIFIEFKERFLKYGEYCSSLQNAQETLDLLCAKYVNVATEVEQFEKNTDNGRFRLRDLLSVPMQRILKYHLLLRELLARTPMNHEEHRITQQAYEAMIDVAEFINEVKRDSETIAIIKEIQLSIIDWSMPSDTELKDYGRMRKDGELQVHNHDTPATAKNPKPRYLFVFDKVLLICKSAKAEHYKLKASLKLNDYKIEDIKPSTSSSSAVTSASSFLATSRGTLGRRVMRKDSSRWTHSFLLVHVSNSNAFTLFARTSEDKQKWMKAFKEAMETINPPQGQNSSHEVVLFTFNQPATCEGCMKLLKGTFFQGYKCFVCSRVMHKDCIGQVTMCGMSTAPPARPPRPLSVKLPTIVHRSSLEDPKRNSFARGSEPPRTPKQISFGDGSNDDYVNTELRGHSWFVGNMDRDEANSRLAPYPSNTFLVRGRMVNGEQVGHALSLKTDIDVKHMKIESTPAESGQVVTGSIGQTCFQRGNGQFNYFLSDARHFKSIVDLITFYCRNSLKECFSGLNTPLQFSVGEVTIVQVLHDYTPEDEHINRLPLKKGDQVSVIDKQGDSGWWKAINGQKIGYIPKDFVMPVPL